MTALKRFFSRKLAAFLTRGERDEPPLVVETERLLLRPLTLAQLHLYLRNDGGLERELGLRHVPREIPEELEDAVTNFFLPQVARHPHNFHFFTLWSLTLKSECQLVGDFCFKGQANEEGQVEIGYGTYTAQQGKGLMTEAVAGILHWCRQHPALTSVLAETETGNLASEKVLERNHFHRYHQGPDNSWWEVNVG